MWSGMHKVHNMYFYIVKTFVVGGIVMGCNFTIRVVFCDLQKVRREADFEFAFGLPNILDKKK